MLDEVDGPMNFTQMVTLFASKGNDLLHEHGEPFIKRDCTITVLVHLSEESVSVSRGLEGSWESKSFLSMRGHINHGGKLRVGDLSIPVGISGLETLPAEPVDLLVGIGPGVGGILARLHKAILLFLVKSDRKLLCLVMGVGKVEPFIKGDSSITVLINSPELVLATSSPPLKAKLLWEIIGSRDHALELVLRDLSIKILVGRDEGPIYKIIIRT